MRLATLPCAAALSVVLAGGALAFDASAPDDSTPAASAANPASGQPGGAQRSALSLACSQKADARNLHGKPRKRFMHECKRGG